MRAASKNKTIRKLRKICRLTQEELAQKVGCARLTIQGLETGRLGLTEKMAKKISTHTGVSQSWLLANDPARPPMCERDLQRPFDLNFFWMNRAEIEDLRTDVLDVVSIEGQLASAFGELNIAARGAYAKTEIIYFNFALSEFLEELKKRWPMSGPPEPRTMDAKEIQVWNHSKFEELRQNKLLQLCSKTS
jgi:transcriptional regulator with XRE-family HTH domain